MDVDISTNTKQYDRECVIVDESSEAWFQVALSVPVDLEQKKEKKSRVIVKYKYKDFILSWRNNATTSRHQRRKCVGDS